MDDETRKIGMLIAAFDAEHERLKIAIGALQKVGALAAAGVQRCCQGIGYCGALGAQLRHTEGQSYPRRHAAFVALARGVAARGAGGRCDRDYVARGVVVTCRRPQRSRRAGRSGINYRHRSMHLRVTVGDLNTRFAEMRNDFVCLFRKERRLGIACKTKKTHTLFPLDIDYRARRSRGSSIALTTLAGS